MDYIHLTIEERCCIRTFYNEGKSIRTIAKLVGRNPSTISREIRRNTSSPSRIRPTYFPYTAQRKYEYRRSFCHRGIFKNEEIIRYVEEKLKETWSPEQISNYKCELTIPSFKTIYNWLYRGYVLRGDLSSLRFKGKRCIKETRGKYNKGKSIRKRDKSVYKRKEFGHWEADTVVSGIGKSKACFMTLIERKTRNYVAIWMPDRKANTLEKTMVDYFRLLPTGAVKTITCDRGSEFANWESIENTLRCDIYFTDPYCAWQKGSNENANGLLREFYPKGKNLSRVDKNKLKKNLELINSRPKKVLGFQKPIDLFNYELTKCCA